MRKFIKPEPVIAGSGRRMQFFKLFMDAVGTNCTEIAEVINCTPLTVRRWLVAGVDDAPLSSVLSAIAGYGYEVDIVLSRGGLDDAEEGLRWSRRNRSKFKADRLWFLSEMMMRYGISSQTLAEKIGLHYTTVDHMFRVNDMSVSRIYRIAEALEMNLYINVHPADGRKPKGITCSTTIVAMDTIPDLVSKTSSAKNEE